jgi:hypothetical protein
MTSITSQSLPYEIMKHHNHTNVTNNFHNIGYFIPPVDTTATISHEWAVLDKNGDPLDLGPKPYKSMVHSVIVAAEHFNPYAPTDTYVIGTHALELEVWITKDIGVVNTSYDIKLAGNLDVVDTFPNVRSPTLAHKAVYDCRYYTLRLDNTGGDGSSYLKGNQERYNIYGIKYTISDSIHDDKASFPAASGA